MGEPIIEAPTDQLRDVAYQLLPAAAEQYAELTGRLANTAATGPGANEAHRLAMAAYQVFVETADRLYDSAVALAKIANGYDLTDELNAGQMPEAPDIVEPSPPAEEPVNPKLKTI